MSDVRKWLEGVGLAQYADAFEANDIEMDLLKEIDEQVLKDIGISSAGHRLRLRNAIAKLARTSIGEVSASGDIVKPEPPTPSAERRQLTVMFCDLVGSTALSARLDPEDMREIIGAYHRCCAEQITKAGGFVAKYLGDGALAYFGYPRAHEDDAERAVRGALSLIETVPKLRTAHDAVLHVRVGIATGLVVVGDLIGEGIAREHGVVGDTPNLAARLQALAEPGQVVISHSTRRLTGGMFEYVDLGRVALKGFAEPMQAWRASGTSAVQSRFEAQHEASLTPLVGREEEMELLSRRWRQAASGKGCVVLISGEPGIGKSRLTVALEERLQEEPHTRLRYFCSPQHTDSAFYPVISQLERAAGFERQDTSHAKLDKLTSLLGSSPGHEGDIQLLAELLSIPTVDRYAPLTWSPQRKKQKTLDALLWQLEMLRRQRPVFVVYEDVHWIDPSSRELLDMSVERVTGLPVLLIITFRPEFQPPWTGQAHVSMLSLNRLGRREGLALVERVAGDNALPDEITAEIVERTDGIPLFVEELTKVVLEAGQHDEDATRSLSTAPLPTLSVPATLHASLMARLDRLGPAAKEIAQIGAAIGREFSYELLVAIVQKSDADLQAPLVRLSDAGLVFCRGTPPQATFLFKHALVRDSAYGSLLRGHREELHTRIAAVLQADFADRVAVEPELLARHLNEAGLFKKAVPYWQRAGERAAERSANLEAIAHLKRGLEVIGRLPESRERDEQELLLQAALMGPFSAKGGYATADLERAASRAVALGGQIEASSPAQVQAVWARSWLAAVHVHRGDLSTGLAIAGEGWDLAKRLGDPHVLSRFCLVMGIVRLYFGDLAAARRHFEEGLAPYVPERDRAKAARYGYDFCMACHSWLGFVLWYQGHSDQALRHAENAVAAARAASHPLSEAWALSYAAFVHHLRGEIAPCLERADSALALATQQMLPHYTAQAMVPYGWALVKGGQAEEGLARLRSAIDAHRAIAARVLRLRSLSLLADACLETGRIEEGLSAVREALAEAEATTVRYYEAEMYRLKGELLLAAGEPDKERAEASFRKAIATAGTQQSKSFELRAATSLARLWRDQGKRTEGRDLLAPIYSWFTEGFDTLDLKEAKALLDELGCEAVRGVF